MSPTDWKEMLKYVLGRFESSSDPNNLGWLCRLVNNGPPDVSVQWVVDEARRLIANLNRPGPIVCRERIGWLLRFYHRQAA